MFCTAAVRSSCCCLPPICCWSKSAVRIPPWCARLLYVVAIIAVILGIIRAKFVYSETVLFANVLVLLCLIISFVRSEKAPQPIEDEEEKK